MDGQQTGTGIKAHCLVIEDSEFDQKMIARAMTGARVHAEISYANTLEKARKALATHSYALIVMDNKLPDGNGGDYARELACDPGFRNVPIVIVSGWPSPFMWDKARAAGLTVIDKNDEPQPKLRDFFRHQLRRNRRIGSIPSAEYLTKYAH